MPLSAQALYFHFCMNADDDGFVKNPKRIQRMLGASDDDCKLLVMKRFVLPFESGVIVIKHWRMHNLLRKDRYKPTEYIEEKGIVIGTTLTVSFIKEKYNSYECSYVIEYKNGRLIYDSGKNIKEGVNCEFVVNCLEPVQNLKAEVVGNDVKLTWEAPRTLTGYKVMRDGEVIAETDELAYTDSNVPNGEYVYSVLVTYNGGESQTETVKVKVEGDGINEFSRVEFMIYPNPAKDVINIKSDAQRYEYQIINSLGQVVLNGILSGDNAVSVENINNGIYFLKLIADGEVSVNRIIIQ